MIETRMLTAYSIRCAVPKIAPRLSSFRNSAQLAGACRLLSLSFGSLKAGIFLAGLFLNAAFSLRGELPWVYPTHLRGASESFAINIGGRLLGPPDAVVTTQLANVMPGVGAVARLAYSAGTVAVLAYAGSLIGSFWFREPDSGQLLE